VTIESFAAIAFAEVSAGQASRRAFVSKALSFARTFDKFSA